MTAKEYLIKEYSGFWEEQSRKYGIGEYESFIIKQIKDRKPKDAFEVGIGNGYPIAKALIDAGIDVDGCDIAPTLIDSAKKNLGKEEDSGIFVGDITEVELKKKYDVVYCVRVSWYLKEEEFIEVLQKMIDATKDNGYVIFDVMNKGDAIVRYKAFLYRIYAWAVQIFKWPVTRRILIGPQNHMFNIKRIESCLLGRVEFRKTTEGKAIGKPEIDGKKTAKVFYVCEKRHT